MRSLSAKGDPSTDQEEKWSPDLMIQTLEGFKDKPLGKGAPLNEYDIKCCLARVKRLLETETSLLELHAPIKVVGDMYVNRNPIFVN